ncbi:hypothetical protein ES703_99201 [subsurface metagenome]
MVWLWVEFCVDAMGNAEGGYSFEPPNWTPHFFGWAVHCYSFVWEDPRFEEIITIDVA